MHCEDLMFVGFDVFVPPVILAISATTTASTRII
jgi:hypothetical protein